MIRKSILILLLASSFNLQAFETLTGAESGQAATIAGKTREFEFRFPPTSLVDHRGHAVDLDRFFTDEEPIVFAFFFTHCVSVCTTLTHTLKALQPQLPKGTKIAMISIDPDTDTPELLNDYVAKHKIDDRNWFMLTGENRDIVDLQKSFEAYRGNKMNHTVSLFLKKSNSNLITEIKRDFASIPAMLARS